MTPFFWLGGALLAGYWLWRLRRNGARDAYIYDYGFPARLRLKLLERYPQLSPEQTAKTVRGLREYFLICRLGGRQQVAMPSQAVDLVWHEFILHTRLYQHFCQRGLGRFLHHTPSEAMQQPTDAQASIRRAWRLACAREGIDPKRPDRLPLLFALDAELGIADGFRYQLQCQPGDQAYCASHIGCSSGCSGGGDSSDGGGGDGGGCGGGGGD